MIETYPAGTLRRPPEIGYPRWRSSAYPVISASFNGNRYQRPVKHRQAVNGLDMLCRTFGERLGK